MASSVCSFSSHNSSSGSAVLDVEWDQCWDFVGKAPHSTTPPPRSQLQPVKPWASSYEAAGLPMEAKAAKSRSEDFGSPGSTRAWSTWSSESTASWSTWSAVSSPMDSPWTRSPYPGSLANSPWQGSQTPSIPPMTPGMLLDVINDVYSSDSSDGEDADEGKVEGKVQSKGKEEVQGQVRVPAELDFDEEEQDAEGGGFAFSSVFLGIPLTPSSIKEGPGEKPEENKEEDAPGAQGAFASVFMGVPLTKVPEERAEPEQRAAEQPRPEQQHKVISLADALSMGDDAADEAPGGDKVDLSKALPQLPMLPQVPPLPALPGAVSAASAVPALPSASALERLTLSVLGGAPGLDPPERTTKNSLLPSTLKLSRGERLKLVPPQREYEGFLKMLNEVHGYGFISCAEVRIAYGRDVYLPKTLVPLGVRVGDRLSFTMALSAKGRPMVQKVAFIL